jgi:hypothetical protein
MTAIVCPLCVQWRCSQCKSDHWPECCNFETDAEPFWPDGTVATITQDDYCRTCRDALNEYERDKERF